MNKLATTLQVFGLRLNVMYGPIQGKNEDDDFVVIGQGFNAWLSQGARIVGHGTHETDMDSAIANAHEVFVNQMHKEGKTA